MRERTERDERENGEGWERELRGMSERDGRENGEGRERENLRDERDKKKWSVIWGGRRSGFI